MPNKVAVNKTAGDREALEHQEVVIHRFQKRLEQPSKNDLFLDRSAPLF
jgi:hypothetical protein